MEVWRDIKGYEGKYQVSNMGNVRSCDRITTHCRKGQMIDVPYKGKLLSPQTRRHGYLSVWLYPDGDSRGKQYSVHRLVAEAFCEKHDGDTEVNHINENKTDNRAENLEWCDHRYNTNFGTAQQRRARLNGGSSRRVRQLDMDGNFIAEYPSLAEAHRQTGTLQSSI